MNYECHVTIEPLFDEQLEQATVVAKKHGFKIATLLMKKRACDTASRSQYDTFMTGHSDDLELLRTKMIRLVRDLKLNQFTVWRYKIEAILLDSKHLDSLQLLG